MHTLSDTSIPKNTMWNQFGRRFCCYKRVTDTVTGKVRKLPFMPNGRRHASGCDPTTWSSLSDCLAARERQVVDGIGLILPAGYACLDFDNLGTECHPWAERCKALASLSGCHSELSQSRQGWHILGTCNVLSRKRQIPMQLFGALDIIVGNDESPDLLYVTGITPEYGNPHAPLGTSLERFALKVIRANEQLRAPRSQIVPSMNTPTSAMASLDDAALLQRIIQSDKTGKIAKAFAGDLTPWNGDHSRADSYLCMELAWWTNSDVQRMDVLFRSSGLMRPKWDEHRGSSTYGQWTLHKVAAACIGGYGHGK